MIVDIFDETLSFKESLLSNEEKTSCHFFKVGFLENCLIKSPYNFDMQISLIRSLDSLGLSISYFEAHDHGLNLKAV